MSAGSGPFGGSQDTWTSTVRAPISASRMISVYGRLVPAEDGSGGFKGMNNTYHRVIVLLGRARLPDIITASFAVEVETITRNALAPLTRGESPALQIEQIIVNEQGAGSLVEIRGYDLLDGGKEITIP